MIVKQISILGNLGQTFLVYNSFVKKRMEFDGYIDKGPQELNTIHINYISVDDNIVLKNK